MSQHLVTGGGKNSFGRRLAVVTPKGAAERGQKHLGLYGQVLPSLFIYSTGVRGVVMCPDTGRCGWCRLILTHVNWISPPWLLVPFDSYGQLWGTAELCSSVLQSCMCLFIVPVQHANQACSATWHLLLTSTCGKFCWYVSLTFHLYDLSWCKGGYPVWGTAGARMWGTRLLHWWTFHHVLMRVRPQLQT